MTLAPNIQVSLSADQVRRFFASHYGADAMVVSVAGPHDHDEVLTAVGAAFADVPTTNGRPHRAAPGAPASGVDIDDDSEQVHIVMGGRALPRRASSRSVFPRGAVTRRVAVLAAAASVAVAAALGITQLSAQHQLDQARATAIARVVTAPDAHVATARTSVGGSVTVVTSAALREAVVSASGMASLPSSRVYQVWVMSPSGARSAGLMHGSSLLASAVRPGDRIGITVEPADGTARPTTTPVAVLPV